MNPAEIDALVASVQAAKGPQQRDDADAYAGQDLSDLGSALALHSEVPLGMLLDLSLPVSIELGRTSMTVQEILRLGRGAVIQLDRLAGEPIDIYVGERKFAEGEVVVVGEHFGVRISRIFGAAPIAIAA